VGASPRGARSAVISCNRFQWRCKHYKPRPSSADAKLSEKVPLAERYAVHAQHSVGRRGMKVEVGQGEGNREVARREGNLAVAVAKYDGPARGLPMRGIARLHEEGR
jgi:hypothetical protein